MAGSSAVDAIGARPIPEFQGVHDVWPRGERLKVVRDSATAYKERLTGIDKAGLDVDPAKQAAYEARLEERRRRMPGTPPPADGAPTPELRQSQAEGARR